MEENQFLTQYRTFNSADLMEIIANASDYQPLAVEAAQFELERRKSSGEDIEQAKLAFEVKKTETARKQGQFEMIKNLVVSVFKSLINLINPLLSFLPGKSKPFLVISVFLVVISLPSLYGLIVNFKFMINPEYDFWERGMLGFLLKMLMIPAITVLFLLRLKVGWAVVALYFTYYATGLLGGLIIELFKKPSDYVPYQEFFQMPSPLQVFFWLLLPIGMIWLLCRRSVLSLFKIDRITLFISLAGGVLLALITLAR